MKKIVYFLMMVSLAALTFSCGKKGEDLASLLNENAAGPAPAEPAPAPSEEPSRDPASDPKDEVGSHPDKNTPVFGVTLDGVSPIEEIVKALSALPVKATVRIVFDEFVKAKDYKSAAQRIKAVSYIMGELLDSLYVPEYSVDAYRQRTLEYLNELGNLVDIWEIGNEVNGEWLGQTSQVVAKILAAFDAVKQKGGKTALTLYYNQDCWERPENEMFRWAAKNLPERLKNGLDYVLISYYEEDCNNLKPNWQAVFNKLGALFPNSKIGFGEVGTSAASKKAEYLKRYYSLQIDHPRYIGGYFWWYFKQDMVPVTKGLWSIFSQLLTVLIARS